MASVLFINRNKNQNGTLTIRFEHLKKQYHTVSRILVDKDFKKYHKKEVRSPELKNKQNKLLEQIQPLEKYIMDEFYKLDDSSTISSKWLKDVYSNYLNPDNVDIEKLNVTHWFEHRLANHKRIKNAKGDFGLSANRIKGIKNIKETVLNYESQKLKRKLKLTDLTQKGFDAFKDFLFDLEYKPTSIHKTLSDVKMIGKYARKQGMKLPDNFDSIEIERAKTHAADEDVIYLTEQELERIKSLEPKQDYLINAKKWLLLGCYTGQRIDDQLTKLTKENIHGSGKKLFIRLTQGKTSSQVTIPIHKDIRDILKPKNMPRPISPQKLNDYMKKVCELAKINDPIDDKRLEYNKELNSYRKIKKIRPKYKYISSHTGRRTFCMLWLNKGMPIQHIMAVTGHASEKSFLTYINKKNEYHLEAYWEKE